MRYDLFNSNAVTQAKLLAGNTGYDVVVPSANFVARQIKASIFCTLDKKTLPNYQNLDPEITKILSSYDAENRHVSPYLWGTTSTGYHVAKIKERMNDAPIDSWDMVLTPEIVARFKDRDVAMINTRSEVMPILLRYLGLPTNSQTAPDLSRAEAALMQVRPHIRYFRSSQYLNDLLNGELYVVLAWSGD